MNFPEQDNDIKMLAERLKLNGITYTRIEAATKQMGLNNGKGYSYSMVRKVLVYQERTNEEIVSVAERMAEAMESLSLHKAA